ncbi:Ig-like domain-containing protein [Gallibacterium trehalosifermentans]|uniref:Ig-like domain-containing protein n=1 Tax=Gallibacterium trehalosifermentans TaxID=516935 RepID=A0ABV6H2Q5_9PAST
MALLLIARKSGKQVNLSKLAKNGKYTELAVPGEEYYLIDTATGKTPEDVKVSRKGDDLIISSEKENMEVIIDEFWHECSPNDQCYAIFDVPATETAEAGQVIVTQTGPDVSAFESGMVGVLPEGHTISPWIYAGLGAAALLGVAAGAGGGSGGSSQPAKDTTAPMIDTDTLKVSGGGYQVSGKTEPGATVTIKDENGQPIGTGTADENGNFTVNLNPPKNNGETLTVEASDKAGNTSVPATVTADDKTAPTIEADSLDISDDGSQVSGKTEPSATVTIKDENGQPIGTGTADENGNFTVNLNPPKNNGETLTVEASDKAGNTSVPATVTADDKTAPTIEADSLDISDDGSQVSGKTEPGATVTIKDENGQPIGTAIADNNGNFDVSINPAKTNGETLTAEATDKAGNKSEPATVVADGSAPTEDKTAPVIEEGSLTVLGNGSQVSGKTEPGATVTVKDANDHVIGTGTADDKGNFTVDLDSPKNNGETLSVVASDAAGNNSNSANVTAPTGDTSPTDGTAPADGSAPSGGTTPINGSEDSNDSDATNNAPELTVTLADSVKNGITEDSATAGQVIATAAVADESGAPITYTLQNNDNGFYQVDENGNITLTQAGADQVNAGKPLPEIRVQATDNNGVSKSGSATAPTVTPTIPGDTNNDGQADSAPSLSIPEAADGVSAEELADGIQIPVTLPANSEVGDTVELTVKSPNSETPITITHVIGENDIKDGPNGTKVVDVIIPQDQLPTNQEGSRDGNYTVSAKVKDQADNSSLASEEVPFTINAGTTDTPADAPTDNSVSKPVWNDEPKDGYADNGVLSGTVANAGTGAKATLLNADGRPVIGADNQPITATVDESGAFTFPGIKADGTHYKVKVTDAEGNSSEPSDEITLDNVAPKAPTVQAKPNAVDVGLPANANIGDTVVVSQGDDSTPITLTKTATGWEASDADNVTINNGVATISNVPAGTTVTAVARDKAGNESTANSTTVVEMPTVESLNITNDDKDSDATGLQVTDNVLNYTYTLGGDLTTTEDKQVRVQLLDENGAVVGTPQYNALSAGENTGSFDVTGVDGKNYTVQVDIVDKNSHEPLVTGKTAEANIDNVTEENKSLNDSVQSTDNTVTIDGTTENFGTPQDDKVHNVDNSKAVYNPKLDWEMRWNDDTMPNFYRFASGNGDNNDGKEYHNDHAPGWANPERGQGYYFTWNGDNERGDVINVAKVRTDDGYDTEFRKGLIGTEDGDLRFDLNTGAGGADYITANGIVGSVRIITNEGDDVIRTGFLAGTNSFSGANFNGSQQFIMGEGNDIVEITSTAAASGYAVYSPKDQSSLFYTNAKFDMGSGNDTLNIAGTIFAGNETSSGNYFNLGSGDDVMNTGTITGQESGSEGSNIINLGAGNDKLTISGDVTSDGGTARFALVSKDGSDVRITGSLTGRSIALMGDGNDSIRIDDNLSMGGEQANNVDWLYTMFYNNEVSGASNQINENLYQYYNDIAMSYYRTFYGNLGKTVEGNHTRTYSELEQYIVDRIKASNAKASDRNNDLGTGNWDSDIYTAARIDLGEGNNTLSVGGSTTGARIIGGNQADTIKLGFDAEGNLAAGGVTNTRIWTGAEIGGGNDTDIVMLSNVQSNNYVYTGMGHDDIQLYTVNGTHNEVHAGAGNDIIRLYGLVNSSPNNIFDGGADHDKVIIGTAEDGQSRFIIGGNNQEGYANLWGIEEIEFNSNIESAGDIVRIDSSNTGGDMKIHTTAGYTDAQKAFNKVELANMWRKVGDSSKTLADWQADDNNGNADGVKVDVSMNATTDTRTYHVYEATYTDNVTGTSSIHHVFIEDQISVTIL